MLDTHLHLRRMRAAGLGFALLALPIYAHAGDQVILSLVADAESVPPGGPLTVHVTASGLGAFSEPSLGGFDVALTFDPAIFEFVGAFTGLDLGDPNLGEAIEVSTSEGDSYQTLVLSLLTPEELIANQSDSVVLFSAYFDALGQGDGVFDLALNAPLSDAFGNPLDIAPIDPLTVPVGTVIDIPTLDGLGLLLLIAMLALSALFALRRNS